MKMGVWRGSQEVDVTLGSDGCLGAYDRVSR